MQQPRLQQRCHDTHVGRTFLDTFGDAADAVTDFQPDVPQEGDEAFDLGALGIIGRLGHQQQDVDIRAGVQLPAAIPAHGNQRPVPIRIAEMLEPGPGAGPYR
ncbi:MAG: hypothetical protein WDM77_04005 [Steroidobacteraceae bacterium]